MADAIFLLRGGDLAELTDRPYDSEDLLQRLLADHPRLIAGAQVDGDAPRRWLLVDREMAVPAEGDGAARWSLGHLVLDRDGVPALVEVKRSIDGRIRREVVRQTLDDAANAVAYWPAGEIRRRFEARSEAEDFWSKVTTNLQAGRVRLIFVADAIPPELRRVVEFLNAPMDPAEVLALEIKRYVGEGPRTLVPRAIGQTAEARRKKSAGRRRPRLGRGVLLRRAHGTERNGEAATRAARRVYEWAGTKGRVWFGSGKQTGSFGLTLGVDGANRYLFAAYTYGAIEMHFQWLKNDPPFADEGKRRELLARLNAIEGVNLPADAIGRRPSIRLATLIPPERLERFVEVLDWAVAEIGAARQGRHGMRQED